MPFVDGKFSNVGASGKHLRTTPDHGGLDVITTIDGDRDLEQFLAQLGVQGVDLGPVEPDDGDSLGGRLLEPYEFSHLRSSSLLPLLRNMWLRR